MTQAIRPAFINCARCGAEKKVGRGGPVPTYCSATCRSSLSHERARGDGRYEERRAGARAKAAQARTAHARPCPFCSEPMANPRRKQCGKLDCKRAFNADRMRTYMRAYRDDAGESYGIRYAEQQREYHRMRRERMGHWRKLYPEAAALADARRRALKAQADQGERFAPRDVHERDGWTCGLCRLPVDPGLAWPHPMSASVDHILPLSRGGSHTLANVQCAHLSCNSRKCDRVDLGATG